MFDSVIGDETDHEYDPLFTPVNVIVVEDEDSVPYPGRVALQDVPEGNSDSVKVTPNPA